MLAFFPSQIPGNERSEIKTNVWLLFLHLCKTIKKLSIPYNNQIKSQQIKAYILNSHVEV